ncbi:hypothetical protein STRPS_0222 [Streptococcus pseudoporcinus LQ 940-04]|uniref:Uncharacterized protein n=2 Tax=Streptococcus pseudoporcinus TaxID=361101 RepID=G5K6Y1_9STRE|nr:hypothetical protein HMPREF9320_1766 [Streptococcus pseudoporcinus SPIN 20026]EHI65908.1 hypothetical protein STRPS_0222 [Streptococcus pseudoporcinus LQ 940-04]VEF94677.1 Uncharacterised protein [Streptococcus pseudoporcinus]
MLMKTISETYENHPEKPYINPKYELDLIQKPIPKRNMIRTKEGLLPGHIVMLWRISFGTYTTESPHHKYFYTTYGIDADKELAWLIAHDYVAIDSAFDSLKHISALQLKEFLKEKGFKGLSKMKRSDLDRAISQEYTEESLGQKFSLRSYRLLEKGKKTLLAHPEIIDRHPQKKY